MKNIPNLLSVQQKCLPPQERSAQKLLTILPYLPLGVGVLMLLLTIGTPEALFSSIFMLISLLGVTLLLLFVRKRAKEKYLKRFTDEQLGRMDRECLSAPHYEGLMVTSDALMYFMPAILAVPVQELVWVYPVAVTHRKGLLEKTYYTIVAITKNKKEHIMLRENRDRERMERSMVFLNEHLKKLRPHLIVGYSEPLSVMYKREFHRMVQMADFGNGSGEDAGLRENMFAPQERDVYHA